MKGKRILWIVGVLVLAGLAVAYYFNQKAKSTEGQYQTAVVEVGDLSAVVGATGVVRARQSADLSWQTNGIVASVNVNVGDVITAGEVLASLDKTSVAQNIILAEVDLISAQRSLEELQTSGVARAQAEQDLLTAQKAYNDAKTRYEGVHYNRASDVYIDNTQAELDLAKQQLSMARRAYTLVEKLADGDARKAQALANMTAAEMRVNDLTAKLNYVTGRPDELEINQRKATLDIATAQLEDAKRKVERLQDGPDPLDVATFEARITAAQATLNMMRLTAPFGGVVTLADVLPGDQAAPGMFIFSIEDLAHLLIDVQVPEVDINNVQVGQEATMNFDAVLGKTYNGTVTAVSRTGSAVQGTVNFVVTVTLTDADEAVKPGMTAAVNIVTMEIENVLTVPNRAVRLVNGQRVVYVLKNGLPTMVKVTLGATSDILSEVTDGELREGDLLILNPSAIPGMSITFVGHPGGD